MDTEFERLIKALQNTSDWEIRRDAVYELADLKTPVAMQAIGTALYDVNPHVMQSAARALGAFRSDAVPLLMAALERESEVTTPTVIVHVLLHIGDRQVIPKLIDLLGHENPTMREASVAALTLMPDERAVPHLLKLLETERDVAKAGIVKALGLTGSPEALPGLKPMLYSSNQDTRRYAALAIGYISHPSSLDLLLEAIQSNDSEVRGNAARAIGNISHPLSLDLLLEATQSNDSEVRSNAAAGLGNIHDERAFNRLRELLKDEVGLVRAMSATAIARLDSVRAVPYILDLLDDPDRDVQKFLDTALSKLGDLSAVHTLMHHYRNNLRLHSKGLQTFAIRHFNLNQRHETAVRSALDALQSDDLNLRIAAVWLLYAYTEKYAHRHERGQRTDHYHDEDLFDAVVNTLVGLLFDQNANIRLSALESLSRIADHRAIENLIRCLSDDDVLIVQKAASVLAKIQNQQAVPALIEKLQSDNFVIRRTVMDALASLGGDEAYQALIGMLDHPDCHTRCSAAVDLGHLGDRRATPHLLDLLKRDPDLTICDETLFGLGRLSDQRATSATVKGLQNPQISAPSSRRRLHTAAIIALGNIADPASLDALYHEVDTAHEPLIRVEAVEAIGAIGTPRERADRLYDLLGHEHDTVRTTAARELGILGAFTTDLELRDNIVSNLMRSLTDKGRGFPYGSTVADMAAKSLYYVGSPEANAALKAWKKDSKPDASDQ